MEIIYFCKSMEKKKMTLSGIIKRWKLERNKHKEDYVRLTESTKYKIVIENLKLEKTKDVPVL
jgi:hypothetical protein